MFRIHLIHRSFASNATSCMMQQLLLRYQIPQYDRHHFPVTGILLIYYGYLKYLVARVRLSHNITSTILSTDLTLLHSIVMGVS